MLQVSYGIYKIHKKDREVYPIALYTSLVSFPLGIIEPLQLSYWQFIIPSYESNITKRDCFLSRRQAALARNREREREEQKESSSGIIYFSFSKLIYTRDFLAIQKIILFILDNYIYVKKKRKLLQNFHYLRGKVWNRKVFIYISFEKI